MWCAGPQVASADDEPDLRRTASKSVLQLAEATREQRSLRLTAERRASTAELSAQADDAALAAGRGRIVDVAQGNSPSLGLRTCSMVSTGCACILSEGGCNNVPGRPCIYIWGVQVHYCSGNPGATGLSAQCAVSSQPPTLITRMLSVGGPGRPGPSFASPLHRQSPLGCGFCRLRR